MYIYFSKSINFSDSSGLSVYLKSLRKAIYLIISIIYFALLGARNLYLYVCNKNAKKNGLNF